MKKFIILISAGLLLPAFCFGAYTYERTPASYTISNPVSFDVSFDNWEDTYCHNYPLTDHWGLEYQRISGGGMVYSEILPDEILTYTFVETLPLNIYDRVKIVCYEGEIWNGDYGRTFEYNQGNPIFEVVEAEEEPAGGIWTIPSDFLSTTTAYIGETFGDIWTLAALVIGLPLSFWGIKKVIGLVKVK